MIAVAKTADLILMMLDATKGDLQVRHLPASCVEYPALFLEKPFGKGTGSRRHSDKQEKAKYLFQAESRWRHKIHPYGSPHALRRENDPIRPS